MVIHSLGNEGPASEYSDCVTLLNGHFAAPQSVVVRRIVLAIADCQRQQWVGESVHQYVTNLRCLASLCKFGLLEDEMICDQLTEHLTLSYGKNCSRRRTTCQRRSTWLSSAPRCQHHGPTSSWISVASSTASRNISAFCWSPTISILNGPRSFPPVPSPPRWSLISSHPCLHWSAPDTITTDNGPQFIWADYASFMEGRGIKHIGTSFYHPQANGGIERFNQTLNNGLRAQMADGLLFPMALQSTLLHYRDKTTDSSPAFLMLGRQLQLPLDHLCPPTGNPPSAAPFLRSRVKEQQRRMKQRFDTGHQARLPALTVNVFTWH